MIEKLFVLSNQLNMTDWGMILLGAQGTPAGKLPAPEISDFACQKIAMSDIKESLLPAISEVAFCTSVTDEIISYLEFICNEENVDLQISGRKWRYVALSLLLENLPNDYVYGSIELNDFWNEWGEAINSPNIVQGVGNNISPSEYYTADNYLLLINKHQQWLNEELKQLI